MPCHIEIAEAELTCASVCCVVGLRSVHLVEQLLRQTLTCLIVLCKGIQELFLVDEVLVELARQLHKISRHISTALRSILAAGQHAMQTMTELMQERTHLIIRKERRFVLS